MQNCIISKSDFLTYLDAPMHLWAQKNGALETDLSPLQVLMMNQGYIVEKLARVYLIQKVNFSESIMTLDWQKEFQSGPYLVRTDALIYPERTGVCDLYEVKSGTSVSKDHIVDAAFQFAVLSNHLQLGRIFILHLNKEYIRRGDLDISRLFLADDITEKVQEILPEIEKEMAQVLEIACAGSSADIAGCYKPNDCPCPALCHPGLPDGSIYEVPGLRENKKVELLEMGVSLIEQIPPDFPLSEKQRKMVDVADSGKPYADPAAIARQCAQFQYPYYFLDYESCISAIPLFDGYHPQQQIVFQYSLHRVDASGAEPVHTEFVDLEDRDPATLLLPQLMREIGDSGTVFVWNKAFEMTRHKEMAVIHPAYAEFLTRLNERIYDLADFIKNGWYLHPDFRGRWSLKNILPVMVPALSYQSLQIHNGSMASAAWWDVTQRDDLALDREVFKENLSQYCELDTLAMVRILEKFADIARI